MCKKISLFVLLLLTSVLFSQNNDSKSLLQNYLVDNKLDSLKLALKKVANSANKTAYINFLANKPTYKNYIELIASSNYGDKNGFLKLNNFINKKVKTPSNLDKINLDFVQLKYYQINHLLNIEEINLATTTTKLLDAYVNRFKNKLPSKDYKKALIYARQQPVVMCIIKQDIATGKSLCFKNISEALALNDTYLIILSKSLLKQFLVYERKLDEYLKLCEELLLLEKATSKKSVFYIQNVKDYLDGLLFKGNFNEVQIENLLNEVYLDDIERSTAESYIGFVKYCGLLDPKSAACARIYKKFKVKNLVGLCEYFIASSKNAMNSNDLIFLNEQCSASLKYHKIFDEALKYQSTVSTLTKNVYSKELSKSLADFQTKEKDFENLKLKQVNIEKEAKLSEQKFVIFAISLGLLLFAFLSYYLFKTIKQRNSINSKLENANQELSRLNILNQKIFTVISHDFKAPISTLKYILNKNNDNNPYISEIVSQLDQSDNMLQGLLDWAKSELNNNFVAESLNLKNFSQIVLKEIEPQTLKKEIKFINNIEADIFVKFPESVLKVVFRNILNNAIKYSFEKGTVEVSFSSNQILVRDFGKGFDSEKLDQIFKQQVASSLGTKYESGFGIGLYFSFEMMKKNGGSIEVFPQKEGTIISINLI